MDNIDKMQPNGKTIGTILSVPWQVEEAMEQKSTCMVQTDIKTALPIALF